jgi:Putative Actinobacterial Holin-X, holin superfamily III
MARSADPNEVRESRPVRSDDRSLGELFSELTHETSTLVRQEVALAKTELSQKATRIGKDVGFLAAGGAIAYAGLLAIIAAIILGLIQLGVTWWLAAAIVGIVVAAIGGVLVWQGINELKQTNPAPTQTLESLKEDAQWTKDQI